MDELSYTLRVKKYYQSKRLEDEDRLRRLQTACEVQWRLIRDQSRLTTSLANCIRNGNKSNFRMLYDPRKDLRETTKHLQDGREASLDVMLDVPKSILVDRPHFVGNLDDMSRNHMMHFIVNMVHRGSWLADRLMRLDPAHLRHILEAHNSFDSDHSVFDDRSRTAQRQTSTLQSDSGDSRLVGKVLDVCRHDSLSLLIDFVGCHTHGRDHPCRNQIETWSEVCHQMLSSSNPQRDKFVVTITDELVIDRVYLGRRALETWLMETLQEGVALLETQAGSTFRTRAELSKEEKQRGAATLDFFLDTAVQRLLDLVSSTPDNGIIPHRAILLFRNIIFKSGVASSRASQLLFFFISNWLFASFLHQHIIFPESRGMLLNYYFSEHARNRILREMANRASQTVASTLHDWKHNSGSKSSSRSKIKKIVSFLRPSDSGLDLNMAFGNQWCTKHNRGTTARSLCASDVFTLVEALYPLDHGQSGDSIKVASAPGPVLHRTAPSGPPESLPQGAETSLSAETGSSTQSNRSIPTGLADVFPTWPKETDRGHNIMSLSKDEEASGLRNACLQMIRITGHPSTAGMCNPIVEDWVLLEIAEQHISILNPAFRRPSHVRSSKEMDTNAESYEEADVESPFAQSYSSVKKAIFDLVERSSQAENPSGDHGAGYTNHQAHASAAASANDTNPFRGIGYRPRSRNNPYRSAAYIEHNHAPFLKTADGQKQPTNDSSAGILAFIEHAIRSAEQEEDYVNSLKHERLHKQVSRIIATQFPLIKHLIRDAQRELRGAKEHCNLSSHNASILENQLQAQNGSLAVADAIIEALRVKLWYCIDVRSSARHDQLGKIASTLQIMASSQTLQRHEISRPASGHKAIMQSRDEDTVSRSTPTMLDILSADKRFCISGKLADEQISVVLHWMQEEGIEDLCGGEERLHRLLCEISRSINHFVGPDAGSSPVLWSSELFRRDRIDGENEALRNELRLSDNRSTSPATRPSSSGSNASYMDKFTADWRRKSFFDLRTMTPFTNRSSNDHFVSRSPNISDTVSTSFRSPPGIAPQTQSSFTSLPSRAWSPQDLRQSLSRESFKSALNVRSLVNSLSLIVTELLVSEFLPQAYQDGSETDEAMWKSFDGIFVRPGPTTHGHVKKEELSNPSRAQAAFKDKTGHDFEEELNQRNMSLPNMSANHPACDRLLHRFELSPSPYTKLKALHDLERLLLALDGPLFVNTSEQVQNASSIESSGIAPHSHGAEHLPGARPSQPKEKDRERSIRVFEMLFENSSTRPPRLFLHLQTIASLVPATILESDARGAAFTHAVIAATTVKHSVCKSMMETADRIVAHHTQRSNARSSTISSSPSGSTASAANHATIDAEISASPVSAAATMLTVAAKGGFAAAQRELATLYLTHPDATERTIMPLTRAGDVFNSEAVQDYLNMHRSKEIPSRKQGDKKDDQSGSRVDPLTLAVARHWMEVAAKGGDALAKGYLASKEETN